MKVTDRLKELMGQLPKGLRSDWQETNHFELTSAVKGEHFWLNLSEPGGTIDSPFMDFQTEQGRRVGLLMDIAEELVKIRDEVNE